jgi:hypothetical protein
MNAPLPTTTKALLLQTLDAIGEGPFSVARVCAEAGIHPSCISRWKSPGCTIEPRLSSVERLTETYEAMLAEWRAANPDLGVE